MSRTWHVNFFYIDSPTPEIYTLSLHDALPILVCHSFLEVVGTNVGLDHSQNTGPFAVADLVKQLLDFCGVADFGLDRRSEEHTSELQSQFHLVCRLLLEKKKKKLRSIT